MICRKTSRFVIFSPRIPLHHNTPCPSRMQLVVSGQSAFGIFRREAAIWPGPSAARASSPRGKANQVSGCKGDGPCPPEATTPCKGRSPPAPNAAPESKRGASMRPFSQSESSNPARRQLAFRYAITSARCWASVNPAKVILVPAAYLLGLVSQASSWASSHLPPLALSASENA